MRRLSPRLRRTTIFVLTALAFGAWLQQSGARTFLEVRDVWLQQRELEREILRLEQENARLDSQIRDLRQNGWSVERLARQKLGLARQGEVVIRIPEKK